MTRILLVGKNGQIGSELHQTLQNIFEVIAVGSSELDITDYQAVMNIHTVAKPEIVINATGYNDVDAAERYATKATLVNVTGNANLAQAAELTRAFYITYSSDYIFDGHKNSAYTESDTPAPLNVYGKTKLEGELAVKNSGVNFLIIRTSSVFSLHRPCFLSNFLKQARPGAQIRVRADLVSSPTSARFLAETTAQIITMGKGDRIDYLTARAGIYQLAGDGSASRYAWAREIQNLLKLEVELIPALALDFPSGTARPAFSALDSSKFRDTFHIHLVSWQQLLGETLKELS